MDKLFDRYSLQARLFPALIVLLPSGAAVLAWSPKADDIAKPLLGLVVGAGALILLAHIAREAGKSVERKLIERWGGWPTTRILRYEDKTIDLLTKERIHARFGELIPNLTMPTASSESADLVAADAVYESCATFVRGKTRDTKVFPLVFTENINYGFRRNLLGLKTLALIVALGCVIACAHAINSNVRSGRGWDTFQVLCLSLCLLLTVVWVFVVRPEWVRRAATDYAKRLIESVEAL